MSRTNKIIKSLAFTLVVGAALAPGAGAASDPSGGLGRTPTEIGQAVGEPGEPTSALQADSQQSQPTPAGLGRTPSEIGHAVGEPGDPNVFGAVQPGNQTRAAQPEDGSGGFDWGDAAIGAGLTLFVGIGAMAILTRRRGSLRKLRTPATSS
jgi:hypothetical protein